jgi:23S rRNA (pseudouridine1915-N3)-methyltransferase
LRLLVIAVGTRMPGWVTEAVRDYSGRMPADHTIEWREIKPEPRSAGGSASVWLQREAERIRAAIPEGARRVALDERGRDLDTTGLAQRLSDWREHHRTIAMLIGGPDGIEPGLRRDAHEMIRLSSLTLPHPLVRVILAEQLYRAWSILAGHPYHRA